MTDSGKGSLPIRRTHLRALRRRGPHLRRLPRGGPRGGALRRLRGGEEGERHGGAARAAVDLKSPATRRTARRTTRKPPSRSTTRRANWTGRTSRRRGERRAAYLKWAGGGTAGATARGNDLCRRRGGEAPAGVPAARVASGEKLGAPRGGARASPTWTSPEVPAGPRGGGAPGRRGGGGSVRKAARTRRRRRRSSSRSARPSRPARNLPGRGGCRAAAAAARRPAARCARRSGPCRSTWQGDVPREARVGERERAHSRPYCGTRSELTPRRELAGDQPQIGLVSFSRLARPRLHRASLS